jgi:hypothetical protein
LRYVSVAKGKKMETVKRLHCHFGKGRDHPDFITSFHTTIFEKKRIAQDDLFRISFYRDFSDKKKIASEFNHSYHTLPGSTRTTATSTTATAPLVTNSFDNDSHFTRNLNRNGLETHASHKHDYFSYFSNNCILTVGFLTKTIQIPHPSTA